MALLSPARIRAAINEHGSFVPNVDRQAAGRALLKEAQLLTSATFDIFLCHSSEDAKAVRLIKTLLEAFGYSVYVDWIEDGDLDRRLVDPRRAALLRHRISRSTSLLFYVTANSTKSRWTPWELGYADGHERRVALLPEVPDGPAPAKIPGNEYLGLYPWVDLAKGSGSKKTSLWVNRTRNFYTPFSSWLSGEEPRRHD